jgi:xylan 1,4-beta-xylosidase
VTRWILLTLAAVLSNAAALIVLAAEPQALPPEAMKSWTSDNGNGTYSNPLFYEEFSDPDVIRVGDDYYLTGTTMHTMPGLYVLHSKDLVNWKLASYCFDRLDLGPPFRLDGGEIYGQGIWAPCIRYHDGMFYIFANINRFGTQVFRSKSANGPWERNALGATLHDLSVLFDDDDKIYAVSGANRITLTELKSDLSGIVPGSQRQIISQGIGEGSHFYKIKGKYYIVSAMPGAHTDMVVARADSLDGPWQIEKMVSAESLGVPTQNTLRTTGRGPDQTFQAVPHSPNEAGGLTLHQGGIVDTPSGQWWSIIMQDHGSVGRLSSLVPVTWDNDFPFIGLPGNLRKAPNTWLKPDTGAKQEPAPLWVRSDAFDGGKLNPIWQWNHLPDDAKWSLTEKPSVLRLHSLPAADFWMARNTLTQRAVGPESTVTVEIDGSGMQPGDTAGLALLNSPFAWLGLVKTADRLQLAMEDQSNGKTTTEAAVAAHLWLRVMCNFDTEVAVFSWSADGMKFTPIGEPFTMIFQLKTFQGVRYCLFNYNYAGAVGGYADFDNFTVEEPRARGVERAIPIGKTIALASVADGSVLVSSEEKMAVESVETRGPNGDTPNRRFKIIDCGNGCVALQATGGRYVSVSTDGSVSLKAIASHVDTENNTAISAAEKFLWVNLLRGHVMLMSMTNHRYLFSKPDVAGPVTANATGPKPDRKDGACFTWKTAE